MDMLAGNMQIIQLWSYLHTKLAGSGLLCPVNATLHKAIGMANKSTLKLGLVTIM